LSPLVSGLFLFLKMQGSSLADDTLRKRWFRAIREMWTVMRLYHERYSIYHHHHHHHLILKQVNKVRQYNYTNKDRHNQAGNCTYSCPEININTSIKHQTVNKTYNVRKHNSKNKVGRS